MKTPIITPLAAAAGLLVTTGASSAATLINTYPTASTSNIVATASSIETSTSVNGPDRTVIEANAGFNSTTKQHSNGTQQSWRSDDAETMGTQWIQWDLGASYVLDSIQLWNFNDFSRRAAGVRQVDIYISNVASPGDPEVAGPGNGDNWSLWASNAILTPGTSLTNYTGFDLATVVLTESFALNTVNTRYVRFEVDSTFRSDGIDLNALDGNGGGLSDGVGNSGLAQIEFYEADAIPEPSAALLGGLSLVALLRRRRA